MTHPNQPNRDSLRERWDVFVQSDIPEDVEPEDYFFECIKQLLKQQLADLKAQLPKKMPEDALRRNVGRIRARNTTIDQVKSILDAKIASLKGENNAASQN